MSTEQDNSALCTGPDEVNSFDQILSMSCDDSSAISKVHRSHYLFFINIFFLIMFPSYYFKHLYLEYQIPWIFFWVVKRFCFASSKWWGNGIYFPKSKETVSYLSLYSKLIYVILIYCMIYYSFCFLVLRINLKVFN